MKIISITLENIRSYLNQTIEFSEGSTLLSGDIGSGKSTILFAIEFALFGMQRGEGDALLRQGKHEGSVELQFQIDENQYTIKRKLKRSASVSQETGYIIKDGVKKEGSTIELKSDVLEILNYPKELLTKKNLIYRYTVYTPQEAMKLILLDNKEFRIDTLRKVFGVDKYKIMRANAELFIKELRQQQRELAVKGEGLGEKEKQQENYLKEISLLDEQIKHASSKKEDAEASLQKVLSLQKEIDEKIKQVAELKNKQASLDTALKSSVELFQSLTLQSKALQDECKQLDDQLKKHQEIDSAALEKKKSLTQQEIQENERKLFSIVKNINEAAVKKEQAQSIKNKIRQLDKCLTCLQQVSENHKSIIMEREDKQISQQEKIISENKQLQLENEKKTGSLKKLLLEIQDREKASEINLINKKNLEEKKQGLKKLELEQDELKKRIGLINADKAETAKNLALQSAIENEHREIRTKVDQAQHGKHSIELQLNGFLKEKQGIQRMLENVEDEIKLKKESLENLKKLGHYEEWLETMFLNLMIEIEKHVMGKLYHEFNELFQRWFKLLMEDETITVHLDGEFAPVITQNGYEVGIEYLSGGEKTSCALSYRLSLNQVINDLLGTVKTKDLIILDEPTDGFSTEQLDKIRDLLQQIQMKQIIIVSHEKKIESFVDHVVQVRKQDHVSEVFVSG